MNHLRNKTIIFFCIPIILTILGCQSAKMLNSKDVQGLKFAYLPKGMNTARALEDCDDIFHFPENIQDAIIEDQKTIRSFINLVNTLEEYGGAVNEDYRLICLIFLKDSKIPKRICFGEGWLINYEGTIMQDNENIFNFLDGLLYSEINISED